MIVHTWFSARSFLEKIYLVRMMAISTLAFFSNPRGLTTGSIKKVVVFIKVIVNTKTLINTLTMDTAVDAAVIRTLGKRLKSRAMRSYTFSYGHPFGSVVNWH